MQEVNRFSEGYTKTSNRAVIITEDTSSFPLIFFICKQRRKMSLLDGSYKLPNPEIFALGSYTNKLYISLPDSLLTSISQHLCAKSSSLLV